MQIHQSPYNRMFQFAIFITSGFCTCYKRICIGSKKGCPERQGSFFTNTELSSLLSLLTKSGPGGNTTDEIPVNGKEIPRSQRC